MNATRSSGLLVPLLFAALSLPALAAISPGTKLTGTIDKNLNSKDAQVGETFTLSNVHSPAHEINGAKVYGHVASVQHAGQGTAGKIELDFDKINTRAGNIYKVTGRATNVKVDTKSNAGKEIASSAGGALVGGLLGGGIGAALGGGAGFAYSKNSKQNVTIPQGSLVTVQITKAYKQKT